MTDPMAVIEQIGRDQIAHASRYSNAREIERAHREWCICLERDHYGQISPCPSLERALEDLL